MPARPATLDIVVPAYNEAERLPATLRALRTALAELPVSAIVTVVDNASDDGTAELVLAEPAGPVPVRLVRCETRGKGHAVRAGVAATTARYVGFCDADLATGLDGLPRILDMLRSGADVVVGSRALSDSIVQARHSFAREWGAALFRLAVRQTVGSVQDTQCGFKFFDGGLARRVFAEVVCGGFAFDVEVLARAQQYGARVVETPVTWVDVPGSTFSPLRDGWRSFVEVASIGRRLRREARIAGQSAWRPAPLAHRHAWARSVSREFGAEPVLGELTPGVFPAFGTSDGG
jgi:dolichyl-phosphate beta-glucosyltransferase